MKEKRKIQSTLILLHASAELHASPKGLFVGSRTYAGSCVRECVPHGVRCIASSHRAADQGLSVQKVRSRLTELLRAKPLG
jgi:hypothetical protein